MSSGLSNVEKVFNVAECIPVVGIISGALRVVLSKIQFIVGMVLTGIGLTATLFSKDHRTRRVTKLGIEHTIHGALNSLKGAVAVAIGVVTFGLGNLLLLIPNCLSKPSFSPVFKYGSISH